MQFLNDIKCIKILYHIGVVHAIMLLSWNNESINCIKWEYSLIGPLVSFKLQVYYFMKAISSPTTK